MTAVDRDLPGAARPGVPWRTATQAALFYLEAMTAAVSLAAVVCAGSYLSLAHTVQRLGFSGRGTADMALFGLLAAVAIATVLLVFFVFFWLLAVPVARRLLCALGSLAWGSAAGLAIAILFGRGAGVAAGAVTGVGIAAVLYWQKCRVVCPGPHLPAAVTSWLSRGVTPLHTAVRRLIAKVARPEIPPLSSNTL